MSTVDAGARAAPKSGRGASAQLAYRPDIDGLRAVAVLAVIGFHTSPRLVPGGFVGVDIFFVISGFLITSLLLEGLRNGRYSALDFYARRVRRIFPALIVVLLACAGLGWFVLVDDEFQQLLKHIAAAGAFVPNLVLWKEAGYFDARSELKPLLHLWSLGIEEQFYLIWPPLLYVCWRRRLNILTAATLIVVASFAINVTLVRGDAVSAFFLPQARLWELLLGGVLAYAEEMRRDEVNAATNRLVFAPNAPADPRLLANLKAWSGVVLVLFAIGALSRGGDSPGWWFGMPGLNGIGRFFGLDAAIAYPGWWATIPTVGTMLVIWAGRDAWLNRAVLGRRPVVALGLISYPLYLWHWPLLSFLQITESGTPTRGLRFAAVALAFVLAALTHVCVERPIKRTMSRRTPRALLAVAGTLAIIAVATGIGYAERAFHPRVAHFATQGSPRVAAAYETAHCRTHFPVRGEYCEEYPSDAPVTTALLGDSHASHFLAGVGAALARRGEGVVHLGDSGCPPLFDIERYVEGRRYTCQADDNAVLEAVGANSQFRRVILAFRGAYDITGTGYGPLDNEEGRASYRIAGTQLPPAESIERALIRTARYFADRQRDVWLILQVPELGFGPADCVGRPFSFTRTLRNACAVPRVDVETRQATYRQVIAEVKAQVPALRLVDPMDRLCDARWCYGVIDGRLLYEDSNHLSAVGSAYLSDLLTFR